MENSDLRFGREQLTCTGPGVTGQHYPGTIFPLPVDPSSTRTSYNIPLPDVSVPDATVVEVSTPVIELDTETKGAGNSINGKSHTPSHGKVKAKVKSSFYSSIFKK